MFNELVLAPSFNRHTGPSYFARIKGGFETRPYVRIVNR
jgi:hypothetical protein